MVLMHPALVERPPAFQLIETVVVAHALLHELQLDAHAGQPVSAINRGTLGRSLWLISQHK